MSKKIEFFTEGEQSKPPADQAGGNQTRRVEPAKAPQNFDVPSAPPAADTGNVTRRVTPGGAAPAPAMAPKPAHAPMPENPAMDEKPAPRGSHTRVLGGASRPPEPLEAAAAMDVLPTAGWLVVMEGPGRGASLVLEPGMSQIGRSDGNRVQLDFGDTAISREAHAFVVYDEESRKFHIGHGGKANLVRVNDQPVLANMELTHGDFVRIGETTLRFVAFCGPHFDWSDLTEDENTAEEEVAPDEAVDAWADDSAAPEPMQEPAEDSGESEGDLYAETPSEPPMDLPEDDGSDDPFATGG